MPDAHLRSIESLIAILIVGQRVLPRLSRQLWNVCYLLETRASETKANDVKQRFGHSTSHSHSG
jgi:hypothetical protein